MSNVGLIEFHHLHKVERFPSVNSNLNGGLPDIVESSTFICFNLSLYICLRQFHSMARGFTSPINNDTLPEDEKWPGQARALADGTELLRILISIQQSCALVYSVPSGDLHPR